MLMLGAEAGWGVAQSFIRGFRKADSPHVKVCNGGCSDMFNRYLCHNLLAISCLEQLQLELNQ